MSPTKPPHVVSLVNGTKQPLHWPQQHGVRHRSPPHLPYPKSHSAAAFSLLLETIRYGKRSLHGKQFSTESELFAILDRNCDGLCDLEEIREGLRRLDVVLTDEDSLFTPEP